MNDGELKSAIGGLVEPGEAFERLNARATLSRSARRFHTGMATAFLVTTLVGFSPTYYLKSVTHAPALTPLVHVHALVFTGWLVLLLAQSALVAAHRVDLHKRLGIAGAALASVMVPLGLFTAVAAARAGRSAPGLAPVELMVFPFGSILLFGAFVAAALWNRRRPELHRRLILLATVAIMTPAIARLPFVGQRPVIALLLSTLFVVAGAVHDVRTRGRVHPLYVWGGLVILASGPVRAALSHTSAWHSFAASLVGS